jgi:S1-C subfamily serine protease
VRAPARYLAVFAVLSGTLLTFAACGGNLMDEPIEAPSPAAAPSVAAKPKAPPGSLFRNDVNATVEEGLGYFLQRVSVDPEIVGGKFQGFRIVELRPAEYWQGVDLKPGDVVTKVNGQSIERDIDAYQAFQGLLAAPALRVSFVRGGSPRELVFAIVDPTGEAAKKAAPAKAAPAAPATRPSTAS